MGPRVCREWGKTGAGLSVGMGCRALGGPSVPPVIPAQALPLDAPGNPRGPFSKAARGPHVLFIVALTPESNLGFPAAPSGKDREFPHVPAPTRTASPLSPSPPENVPRASPSVSLH